MEHARHFYIDGRWVTPHSQQPLAVMSPATEQAIDHIILGDLDDVDAAVAAAARAFETWSLTSVDDRLKLFDRIIEVYESRLDELASVISQEMGAPISLARQVQAPAGLMHLTTIRDLLKSYQFENDLGTTRLIREPIGVCALITPWNWPINQISCKVAPALAAGCTMVLKPSEIAPLNAVVFTEVLHEAGVPAGVFNLVHGDGPTVGTALSVHPHIDMVSFTGSTRAGVEVATNAAATVKRVAQELGGKSANIVLDDADLVSVVERDVRLMCINSGQSCNAPSRMLVPEALMAEAAEIAVATAHQLVIGDPEDPATEIGPVASKQQYDKIQTLIQTGVDEGATVVVGGPGRPDGYAHGYYVKPTVFSNVTNDMTIAREEIFGPVLVLIGYKDDDDAVRIANDTAYGLAGYVSGEAERAQAVARRIRAGQVHVNGAPVDPRAPFGGYKRSGNGREWGELGLEEFLESKAVLGYR